ncbi:MAG: 30S ribosomal protein S12 methylthiotransferase RimO, partial [Gammaproteobacteria bacterium]|nr:30S ribosomal protein S12 methylthiotransferase RimO [Gammaproteobacteria bacterium]
MQKTPHKIGFVSLGCPKATVDSERLITQLRAEGYDLVPGYDEADMVIINTCGFIDSAVEESLETIAEALRENGKVVVTGCLGARAGLIREKFPDLLAVTGPQAKNEVMQAVHRHLPAPHDPFFDLVPKQGIKLTPQHYAYLKISEGCNHRCSFCIIPSFRGDLVSRPIDEVMQEAAHLAASGVKEILVISQDTSAYGVDLRYATRFWQGQPLQTRFLDLARALGQFGLWVRLHYVYPYPHVDDVIPLMADGLILPYLDIPFQHASLKILKAMKRPGNRERVLERIHRWRELCSELVIRSTFIVGFPGETDDDFQHLLDFLDAAQLDRVGCFIYSPVEGAAANDLPDQVQDAIKQQRYDQFMLKQQAISTAKLRQRVGQELQVLVEAKIEDGFVGRSYADAPEIDGLVYIDAEQELKIGEFYQVRITASDEYDCHGH